MVALWESDHSNPDPYDEPEISAFLLVDVHSHGLCLPGNTRRKLVASYAVEDAQREMDAAQAGLPLPDILSLLSFIRVGLDLARRQ
jgi:hypothetical protein